MAILPKINKIQLSIESGEEKQENRPYIGYSKIGAKCKRSIWLSFRWAYPRWIEKRIARIFERGLWEENRIIIDLIKAGYKVTGEQKSVCDETGHIKGHIDGLVHIDGYSLPLLLEMKTMNSKRYATYLKEGLKRSDPEYYAQINMYMGKLSLEKCLFITVNKDNEERHYEIYDFDQSEFEDNERVALDILISETPPPKIGGQTYFACKMCSFYKFCHKNGDLDVNCRTCKNASIEMGGAWSCDVQQKCLSIREQQEACESYTPIEM